VTLVLGIESSCDETAVALVQDGLVVRGHALASQIDLHARFGGVIPEVASRSHLEAIFPLLEDALAEAGVTLSDVDALAVTTTPGLVGCLLVGLHVAKGLSLVTGLPLVPVNHVHAHIWAALMEPVGRSSGSSEETPAGELEDPSAESPVGPPTGVPLPLGAAAWVDPGRPIASLVVSGGHTSLYASRSPTQHELLGATIDDAAGEAYDKVSALLKLGYPGGPVIDRLAQQGDATAFAFPRSRPGGLDFSFSGLKTAVLYGTRGPNAARKAPLLPGVRPADVAASFQAAVVDVLGARLLEAARQIEAQALVVSGGVAANSALRARVTALAAEERLPLYLPSMRLTTDNAMMIAGLGQHLFEQGAVAGLEVDAAPRAD